MKLTKKKAKELCILKWEYIVENNGSKSGLINKYPEMGALSCQCAYCELYIESDCMHCPLNLNPDIKRYYGACHDDNHPWIKWLMHSTKENAQAVLDLIKNSK